MMNTIKAVGYIRKKKIPSTKLGWTENVSKLLGIPIYIMECVAK